MPPVSLRPLAPNDFQALCAGHGIARRPTRDLWRLRIRRSGMLVDGRLDLAIVDGDRFAGTVEARQPHGALPEGAFEIGITLFAETDRGRGVGTHAVALLTELLFAKHGAERIQASTWVENRPMRGVLEKLGWTYEGTLRSFWPLGDGRRQDFALYSILEGEGLRGERSQTSR